jgi:hypothetical protein
MIGIELENSRPATLGRRIGPELEPTRPGKEKRRDVVGVLSKYLFEYIQGFRELAGLR